MHVKITYRFILTLMLGLSCALLHAQLKYKYEQKKLEHINSKYDNEYAPVVYDNQLIYVTDKQKDNIKTIQNQDGMPITDLHTTPLRGKNRLKSARIFAESIMSPQYESAFCIAPDSNTMYITRSVNAFGDKFTTQSGVNFTNIYVAKFKNNAWEIVSPFQYSNPEYIYRDPAVSADGRYFYFSSNMPGGAGGFDLYECRKLGEKWGKPKNLGEMVNTKYDELYAFHHPSERLYFSTKGHAGIGKTDIFFTMKTEDGWLKPKNAGKPINSRYDDAGLYLYESLDSGYVSRYKGNFDIHRFKLLHPIFEACTVEVFENLCFTFFQENAIVTDSTTYRHEWNMGDGKIVKGLEAYHCFPEPGIYIVQLDVVDTLLNERVFTEANYVFQVTPPNTVKINVADTVKMGEEIQIDAGATYLNDFSINDYYWFVNDKYLNKGAVISNHFNKTGVYTIKLGITSEPNELAEIETACGTKQVVVIKK